MKKIGLLSLILILLMSILVGCDNENEHDTEITMDSGIIIEYEDDGAVVMTDEEKQILCSTYVNEDRINAGELYDYQVEALIQFRFAKEYLQKKYPGYEYNFFVFSPSDKFDDFTTLEFNVDDTENYFTVKVIATDEGYEAEDNLWGYVLRPDFQAMMEELLSDAGLEDFYVFTKMSGYYGEEIAADTTVDEIVDMGRDIKTDLQVFVDMDPSDETKTQEVVDLIEKQLRSIDNYGGHIVYFEPGISEECSNIEECFEYRNEHYDMYSISFNTFDENE